MDNQKVGNLIHRLRTEKQLTQKQLADEMNISDKTISKWECGLGCPDVSLLRELSEILGVDIERILAGDLEANERNGGNMRRLKFYVCPTCGNTMSATGEAQISCCGRKLMPLQAEKADEAHRVSVQEVENDYYITFSHEMEKSHYIGFAAVATYDRVLLVKLYPEQGGEIRIPRISRGKLFLYCTQHGLMECGF